jgi:hypothetical protein
MLSKDIKSLSKHLNIEPIKVIEPYNPQIVEFENIDDFNIYYNTHKEEFDNMTTQKLNTKYKIPGYKLTKKSNELKLIKDYNYHKRKNANTDSNSSEGLATHENDIKELRERITFLEKQIDNINTFLSNM